MYIRKAISFFLAISLGVFSILPNCVWAETDISVMINGQRQSYEQPPAVINGRTFVPLRGIFEALGADVTWDQAAEKVTAVKNNVAVELVIGNHQATVNGVTKVLDEPAQLINDRTMVPVRFISEAMGAEVKWDEASQTVMITTASASADSTNIDKALTELDSLFKDYFTWLAGQYNLTMGGFYYARSSFTSAEFKPDIESTAQALNIIKRYGLFNTMPDAMKQKMIQFFQSRQDAKTGYFIDPQNNMKDIERMRGRALSYAKGALSILGAQPLYPLPGTEAAGSASLKTADMAKLVSFSAAPTYIASSSLPDYMTSPEKYRKWMEQLNWSDSWTSGDAVQTTGVYLNNMSSTQRQPFLDQLWDFAEKTQDQETGLWGTNSSAYNRVSGAFKFSMLYSMFKRPMPNADKIYASTIKCMREEHAINMMWIRNPLDLLGAIRGQVADQIEKDLPEIIKISTENLKIYCKPDGGFSFQEGRSEPAPNSVILGLGMVESDMNAATGASSVHDALYQLAGKADKSSQSLAAYTKGFYDNVNNLPRPTIAPQSANTSQDGFNEDFNSLTVGEIPAGWIMQKDGGTAVVAVDPLNPNNKVLQLDDTATDKRVSIMKKLQSASKKFTFEYKILVPKAGGADTTNNASYSGAEIALGGASTAAVVLLDSSKSLNLGYKEANKGVAMKDISQSQWHQVKIAYTTGAEAKVSYFIDGNEVKEAENHYNSASMSVDTIRFMTSDPRITTIYFDDIKVTIE